MTETGNQPIRLRRHVDGRVALGTHGVWVVLPGENWWRKDDSRCSGDGWSELFVAELPEPDYYELKNIRMAWNLHTGELTVGELDGELQSPYPHTLDSLRSDALKMLAAVAACEQYRASTREME